MSSQQAFNDKKSTKCVKLQCQIPKRTKALAFVNLFMDDYGLLKFIYYEKVPKFEKYPTCFRNYLVKSKQSGIFFQIF